MAAAKALVPYWQEAVARDQRSNRFREDLYELAYTTAIKLPFKDYDLESVGTPRDGRLPLVFCAYTLVGEGEKESIQKRLTVCSLSRSGNRYRFHAGKESKVVPTDYDSPSHQRLSVRYATDKQGMLRLDSITAHCIGHDHRALRIEDRRKRIVWEDLSRLHGECMITAVDFDGDAINELFVFQNDHGQQFDILLFEKKVLKGSNEN